MNKVTLYFPYSKLYGLYNCCPKNNLGEGIGYNDGKTIVKVYISNGVISNIEIISSDDDAFSERRTGKRLSLSVNI